MKRTPLPILAAALVASALGLAGAQAPAPAVDVKVLQERNTVSSLLVRLGGTANTPAVKTTAPHMRITSYLSDPGETVAPPAL